MPSTPAAAASDQPSHLDRVPVGQRVRLLSLPADPVLSGRLRALGIGLGAEVEVVRRGTPGGILHLAHGPLEFMLRRRHAAEIAVERAALSPQPGPAGAPPDTPQRR